MTIEAIRGGQSIENYLDAIETMAKSGAEAEQTIHNSTPWNDVPTHMGGEGSVVTIGGFALTLVISGATWLCCLLEIYRKSMRISNNRGHIQAHDP